MYLFLYLVMKNLLIVNDGDRLGYKQAHLMTHMGPFAQTIYTT